MTVEIPDAVREAFQRSSASAAPRAGSTSGGTAGAEAAAPRGVACPRCGERYDLPPRVRSRLTCGKCGQEVLAGAEGPPGS